MRDRSIERLRSEAFDVLVIGGGVTGAGAAWDGALRKLNVALVEKDDFGSGTSSRSSKLLHGGLRYLRRLEFRLVHEGLRERRYNEHIAPHLTSPLRFVVPLIGSRRLGVRLGLLTYDFLALGSGFPRHERLDPETTIAAAPALRRDVGGALAYWDARIEDARLAWTLARSAHERGAAVANHAAVVDLSRDAEGRIDGARVRDGLSGETFDVRAKVVVNATGVWADEIRTLESPAAGLGLRPSKGTHLVFSRSAIPLTGAALLVPTSDRRFVFVIPWVDDTVIVGTTDVAHEGPIDEPVASSDEIDYLLAATNEVLARKVSPSDIVSTFAGLRPLIASRRRGRGRSKDISRRHLVRRGPGGVITVTGGKLTAWRPMAEDAIDAAVRHGGFGRRPSRMKVERLSGAAFFEGVVPALRAVLDDLRLDSSQAERLYDRYGSLAAEVQRLPRSDAAFGERLHPQAPYLKAEAEYAIASEMAGTAADVMERRLRLALTTTDHGEAARAWISGRLNAPRG